MPASTSDPISSVLQRTFGGLDHKREGLMRGGNSSSARPNFSVDKQIQASAKHGLVTNSTMNGAINFDAPTSFKSDTKALNPKIIVLNPKAKLASNGTSVNNKEKQNETKPKEGVPEAKVTLYAPTEIKVGYSQNRVAGSGMANAGNTCYLNSTLQALFHTPALFNYFQYNCVSQHMSKCSSSMGATGFLQSCTICAMMNTLKDSLKSSVIRPNRIYEKLKIICKHMVMGRQEDAHEFLRYLIDSLQRSYLNTVPGSKTLDSVSKETTPFNQIFGGYMRQEVTCIRCKHVSTTFQHFMDILVDIQQANTIEDALAQFFRQRKLGYPGDEASLYKCEKCKVKVQAKWQCFLEKPPAVLCVQLKRFSLLGGKIGKPIQLCRKLNINPFLKQSSPNEEVNYLLRSMITHVGPSPNCGHYTAIGEAANGQFYQFDDAQVRPIPINQVLRTASYVVFFEMTPASWAATLRRSGHVQNKPTAPPPPRISSPKIGPQLPKIGPNSPKIINKLGVVSSAAKNMVTNVISDFAKTVTKPVAAKSGLVPYDSADDSSDNDEVKKGPATLPSVNKPNFVPRALTVKKIVEGPVKALEKPVKAISATARNWTVTDVGDSSVHSDNSTGSTNGTWIVSQQRPSSAMSEDSSKSSSKWTVTNLKKAIDTAEENDQKVSSATSTPASTSSSTSSKLTPSRKRPSLDENSDYDDELDRGRVKKVKKSGYQQQNNFSNGNHNPFQKQQDWQNRSKMNGHHQRSNSHHRWDDNRSYNGKNRFYGHDNRDNRKNQFHFNGKDRRQSFGSFRDNAKDKYYRGNGDSSRRYDHHHDSSHYRDNFHHRRSSR